VEEELSELLEAQQDDVRILRGAALSLYGDSYLDRAQKVAELESELKLQRFARDIPKYERSQQLQEDAANEENEEAQEVRDSIEDLFFAGRKGRVAESSEDVYEPVMYKIVKTNS
jgi:hypothetical protein